MEEIKQSGGGRQEGQPPETAVRDRGCRGKESREKKGREGGVSRGEEDQRLQ